MNNGFDEFKHRRARDGRFTEKPAPVLSTDSVEEATAVAAMEALAGEPPTVTKIGNGAWRVGTSAGPPENAGGGMVRIQTTGTAAQVARVHASIAAWPTPPDLHDTVAQGCDDEQKVTIMRRGETVLGATMVTVEEGTLVRGTRGEAAFLPKGRRSRGYLVDHHRLLDVRAGWGKTSTEMRGDWIAHARRTPSPTGLDQTDLDALPVVGADDVPPSDIALTVFGTHPGFGDGPSPGCVWFVTDYDPENDIANGYMWAPPGSGLESEHGSINGRHLRAVGGQVRTPAGMTFEDCFDLPADHASMWDMLRGA